MYVCMCVDMYICMYMHVCMYLYIYAFIYMRMCMCMHICAYIVVSRAKWPNVLKCSLEIRFARRSDARLPHPTLTGGHQVCITRQGDPALRLPTNRGRENHFFASPVPQQRPPHPEVGQITWNTGLDKLLG